LIFLWVVDQIFIVVDVNALLLMYRMYRVSESDCDVRDKNNNFLGYFQLYLSFLIFLWIIEHIIVVAGVNAHLVI
jgi:hypothetical protein